MEMITSTRQLGLTWLFTKAFMAPDLMSDVRVKITQGVAASAFAWKEFKA